jgi:hypothetical protein
MTQVQCYWCKNTVEDIAAEKVVKHFSMKYIQFGKGKICMQPAYRLDVYICLDCKGRKK